MMTDGPKRFNALAASKRAPLLDTLSWTIAARARATQGCFYFSHL
jgi:hypothetical protein